MRSAEDRKRAKIKIGGRPVLFLGLKSSRRQCVRSASSSLTPERCIWNRKGGQKTQRKIDERFPHPQLMPGDPVDRARVRLFLLNFEKELFAHVMTIESRSQKANEKVLEKARSHIRDRLTQLAPVFLKNKFMLGDNFSMLDVAIAPLLWRLDHYGIELSKNAAPLLKYAERIFSRPAYIEALTPSEKVMRK